MQRLCKHLLLWLTVALMLASISPASPATALAQTTSVQITFAIGHRTYAVNGKEMPMDAAPFLAQGHTYLPVRYLSMALGVPQEGILWKAATQEVRLTRDSTTVLLQVGSPTVQNNSTAIAMDVIPLIHEGHVYLPARWVAAAFGYGAHWDADSQVVRLTPLEALQLATLSPLTGGSARLGTDLQRGAEMAVQDYRERFRLYGFPLALSKYDDEGRPELAAVRGAEIRHTSGVIGVVGTLNSSTAVAVAPILARDSVVMLSPSNTLPTSLTKDWPTYNRLLAPDDLQAPAAAAFASGTLGTKVVYVLHDGTAYGQPLATAFAAEAAKRGIQIAGTTAITPGSVDLMPVLTEVRKTHPDLIFYGGFHADAARIITQARQLGYAGRFMGSDALDDAAFGKETGDAANGTYFTSSVPPANIDATFAARYEQAYGVAPTPYAAPAYDAASIILNSTLELLKQNPGEVPSTAAIAEGVRATKDYHGITGDVHFDERGVNIAAPMWIYQYKDASYPAAPVVGQQVP